MSEPTGSIEVEGDGGLDDVLTEVLVVVEELRPRVVEVTVPIGINVVDVCETRIVVVVVDVPVATTVVVVDVVVDEVVVVVVPDGTDVVGGVVVEVVEVVEETLEITIA